MILHVGGLQLEVKYYNDFNENYIIIKYSEDKISAQYPFKMLTKNTIKGILPCTLRFMNGEAYLYYNITSKQSLENLFKDKNMDKKYLMIILFNLVQTCNALRLYLLDYQNLILRKEYIFIDLGTLEVYFLYYPAQIKEGEKSNILELLDFLIKTYDHQEKGLIDAIYHLYQMTERGSFSVKSLEVCLDEMEGGIKKDSAEFLDGGLIREETIKVREKELENKTDSSSQHPVSEFDEIMAEFGQKKPDLRESSMMSIVVGICCVVCASFLLLFKGQRRLTWEQQLICTVGIVVLFAISFMIFTFIILKKVRANQKQTKGKGDKIEESESECYALSKEESYKKHEVEIEKEDINMPYDGGTVFISPDYYPKENKLFGISKGNKYHIDLNRLPITIGKSMEYADIAIPDHSISRRHVRFSKKEEKVVMTDLNSTNGTYKNGMRMNPNETVEIELGDEIRLGKLKFAYR